MQLLWQRRWMCWLALVALMSQLVLSFAHQHARPDASQRAKAVAAACLATGQLPCPPVHPTDHRSDCQVCWTMAMAGTGLAPAGAAIPVPVVLCLDQRAMADASCPKQGAASQFQARAPPLVRPI